MTISGSTNFESTDQQIVKDAMILLNAIGADQAVSGEDFVVANRVLNRMIKTWSADDVHLWKRATGTIFLQKSQALYTISQTSSDHYTDSYVKTTLTIAGAIGDTTLNVASSAGMTAGDYIGIENNNNILQWTTIVNVLGATSVIVAAPLTVIAASGLKVYAYTTKISLPFNVYSAVRRRTIDDIDVPMNYLSYQAYFQLPNKISSATIPVSYNYDRQLTSTLIRVWPMPGDVNNVMNITYAKKIDDFDSVVNTPDFPQEWEEAIVYNLAFRLAPIFGKSGSADIQLIKAIADESLNKAMNFDIETGSLFFQVRNV
jgi:hypothetical protein